MNEAEAWREWGRGAPPDALKAFLRGDLSEQRPRSDGFRLKLRDCEQLDLEVFPGANQIDFLEE